MVFDDIRLENDQQFEAMSRLLSQTELAEGQVRPIERVNELSCPGGRHRIIHVSVSMSH